MRGRESRCRIGGDNRKGRGEKRDKERYRIAPNIHCQLIYELHEV